MQIFINDLSLEGQYFSETDFREAVKIFVGLFSLLNEKIKEKQLYKDNLFINQQAIKGEHFQASFEKINDRSLQMAFREIIFNKLNPKDWRQEQKHSSQDDFWYLSQSDLEPVTDTTLAEAAERVLQDEALVCLLINFVNSRFSDRGHLPILKATEKDKDEPVDLACIEDKLALKAWLETTLHLSKYAYDDTSTAPPTDNQTILKNRQRFNLTTSNFQGRRIYKEITTGYHWYVDNLHFGPKAHLEVFNGQTHIGEATLDGTIDLSKADPAKTLKL